MDLRRRFWFVTISALLLAFTAAVPVQADTELGQTGTTGFHALRDSPSRPGYTCHYKGIYPPSGGDRYEGKLNQIDVRPPRMKAIAGHQEVGWRFMIERLNQSVNPPIVMVTYKSSIQRDTTSSSRNASFSMRSVSVRLPADGAYEDTIYEYRVKVKMFWYTANGGVQGTSTHRADWFEEVLHNFPEQDGGRDGTVTSFGEQAPCRGWVSAIIN
ncbi:MAG TPA: hypothetical protein VEX62_08950 [Candidatus Limnocylindrales bacterium]|nr:hypothetical protein [Candidatus Limnocylindrales bacterium]